MVIKRKIILITILLAGMFCSGPALSQPAPEEEIPLLFTTLAPDALIVLDLSGSMRWTPAGERMYINPASGACGSINGPFYPTSDSPYTTACDIASDDSNLPKYGDADCVGPFYRTSGAGRTTDCSRVAIAKRAIFDILDDNDNNEITNADQATLNVRFGYMRFYNCAADEIGGSYSSGCNQLIWPIDSPYSRIYCDDRRTCSPASSASGSVSGEAASGGTPLASALHEAKLYLDFHKASDSYRNCRRKFAILITDGADTFACGGDGSENSIGNYKGRRETVAKAKALADAGYKVFVVGFGASMPHWLRNTLNWAAYWGGTENPLASNSGDPSAYNPSSVTSCEDTETAVCNLGGGEHYYAVSNDPGEIPLNGYAFLAENAVELANVLKQALEMIRETTYSFTLASVSSQRTTDENYLYEASFEPQIQNNDPFWPGHLKKFNINADGTVGSEEWNAGYVLRDKAAGTRSIKTLKSGSIVEFNTTIITTADLGITPSSDTARRDAVVGYIRGESGRNPDNWKLGDIFHSNPITIGSPSPFFDDSRDANRPTAFSQYRANNPRTSANGLRVIVAGANDGQLHVFKTSDGEEVWSFIPPNLLPKLKNIAHSSHPTTLTHQYFVDGPITVADVWLGSGDGTSKSASKWKTLLILGEGRGGGSALWSSSTSCDSGLNATYSATYSNYCGYYAFDFTSTLSPIYRWRINPTLSQAPYLANPWSKVMPGRVLIGGNEKWVGFVGGGYNTSDCRGGGACDSRGKGFYVIDLDNGNVLWSYNRGNDSTMNHSLPATPAIVDTDNDGFIDTVYIGDLGGDLWRFKFCTRAQGDECSTSNWEGGRLFDHTAPVIRPIFTTPAVSRDRDGNLWVQWGTGAKDDPTEPNAQEKFYAAKDNARTGTLELNDLENITTGTYSGIKQGWYINFTGQGEKVLSDPTIFGGVAYFTTFKPTVSGGDPCGDAGQASLYGVNFTTGAGVLPPSSGVSTDLRSMVLGYGIATSPIISFRPSEGGGTPDLYITLSGGAGTTASSMKVNLTLAGGASRTNILYWKDRRLE